MNSSIWCYWVRLLFQTSNTQLQFPSFMSDSGVDSQTTLKSFIRCTKQINHSAVTHTLIRSGEQLTVKVQHVPRESKKRILVWCRKGLLFTRCQSVGIQAQISYRETLSLQSSLQDPVWPGWAQFGHLGTLFSEWFLSPIRTKCRLVEGTQRGESLHSTHLLSSPLAPRPTARLLEFKPGHVLVITLPQWPCWAQHLESHKNIIVRLLGSFVHYHKGWEKTKMLTPQGFAEAHFSDSAPSLPNRPPGSTLRPHWRTSQQCPRGTSTPR